jgi:aryl-alcohol dehydrogenase-like predicted oxidoreductase
LEYKTLGNTGLLVSKLCLGTMTFGPGAGDYKLIGNVDQKGADELVKGALDAGVNLFDTADIYSNGESEKILGQSFKNLGVEREDVVIATKVYGRMGPGRSDVGASRGHIMDAVEASLKRLQTDHIDLYQVVTIGLDADLLRWFRQQRGYQTRINAILRTYMNAHILDKQR